MEDDLELELEAMIAEADAERAEEEKELDEEQVDDNNIDSNDTSDDGNDDTNDNDNNSEVDKDENSENDNNDNEGNDEDDNDEFSFKQIEVEVDGVNITVDSQEELLKLVKNGLSQKKERREESDIEMMVSQGKLSKEDLTLIIDANNGDVNAIAKIAANGNIDVLDIESENAGKYESKFSLQVESDIEKVAGEILNDTELAISFKETIGLAPDDFVQTISSDANMLRSFSGHVKSGLAKEIIPLAKKAVALNGGTFFENYAKIGQSIMNDKASTTTKKSDNQEQQENKREISEREKKLRNRANSSNKSTQDKSKNKDADDISNMSEEEFEALIVKG